METYGSITGVPVAQATTVCRQPAVYKPGGASLNSQLRSPSLHDSSVLVTSELIFRPQHSEGTQQLFTTRPLY